MKKAAELLKEYFGIEDATSKKLEGYGRSINYQVDTAQGEKFVFISTTQLKRDYMNCWMQRTKYFRNFRTNRPILTLPL